MHDATHRIVGTQRLVRTIRRTAARVARGEIAASKMLGTVTATSPLTVTLDGSTVAVAANRLNSYTPTVNDRVLCERFGRQVVVLGTFT